jgi:hypothetical protein
MIHTILEEKVAWPIPLGECPGDFVLSKFYKVIQQWK